MAQHVEGLVTKLDDKNSVSRTSEVEEEKLNS